MSIDRLSIRQRPDGIPLMEQHWGKLLFMHWPIPTSSLRPLIPEQLTIDEHEGTAYIGIIPFTMWDVRLKFTPAVPWLSDFHEMNVRTYVHYQGVPGVWFFSLDTPSTITVMGARALFHLPYHAADIDLKQEGDTIRYHSQRAKDPGVQFQCTWHLGDPLPTSEPGSLEFFLTERYCLYSASGSSLYRGRIHHPPWPLQRARVSSFRSTMLEPLGLAQPEGEPLLQYAEAIGVDIWGIEEVA